MYNFGSSKGSPLIGAGIENTYRLSDPWQLYLDVAYNGVSSGFTGDFSTGTGGGNGGNMYFTADIGVRYLISDHDLDHRSELRKVFDNLWSIGFVQLGADMTLYNPCEEDFSEALDKGLAFGADVAIGKRFSPEVALHGRLNCENGLVRNPNLERLVYGQEEG